jgi:predicted GNAT family acetyltransferase
VAGEKRSVTDRGLDETLEETFPASDAPANTVETGIRIRIAPIAPEVIDSRPAGRVELTIDTETAVLVYRRTSNTLTLVHTEVPPALASRRIGDMLVEAALESGHREGLRIVAECPFARAYLRKHRGAAQ